MTLYKLKFFFILLLCSTTILQSQIKYTDASNLKLIGKILTETETLYERLPIFLKEQSRPAVWNLGKNTSGLDIRFKTNIIKSDGSIVEKYLYDIDQEIEGRIYYFNTLADVKVSNVQVKYNPLSYSKKTVDVIYTLDIILGYQKIRYTLYIYFQKYVYLKYL